MDEMQERSDTRLLAALGYIPPLGLIFYFIERENKFLRFHGLQAALLMIFWAVFVIDFIALNGVILWAKYPVWGIVFYCLSAMIYLTLVVASAVSATRAYKGQYFRLPFIGNAALNAAK